MKKQLLSIVAALTVSSIIAQTPSPSWPISQNASFSITTAGHRFMDAVDQNVVWVCGYDGSNTAHNYNFFARSINGGTSFNSGNVFPDTTTYAIGNMEAIDANTAWVSAFQRTAPYSLADQGGGVLFRTTNGGSTWTNMTAPGMFTNVATSFCNWVSFLTPQVGIANGDPVNGGFELWRTTNGGTSWAQVPAASIPAPITAEFCIVDLYSKVGASNLWYGTNKGRIYRTADAGVTWNVSALPSSPTSTVSEVQFTDLLHGIVYATTGTAAAPTLLMYNTNDGGITWNLIHNNVDQPTSAALFIGRNEISAIPGTGYYASVDNQNSFLSYSTDNGVTWNDWGSVGIQYVTIDMVDGHTGWVGGFSDATTPSVGGIFKYNGITFNSAFTIPEYVCKTAGNATLTPLNGSSASTPLTFSWTASSQAVMFSSATATTPVITFTANGTYTISLAATNIAGTSTSTHVVTVLTCAAPATTFSLASTSCNNTSLTLTATTSGAPVPVRTLLTNPPTNVTVTPSGSSNYTLRFADAGTYTVTLNATSVAGTDTHTQVITIEECLPNIMFTLPTDEICRLDTVVAVNSTTANTLGGPLSYTWSIQPSQPGFTLAATPNNRSFVMSSNLTYPRTFSVTLKAKNTTTTSSVTQTITVGACVNGIAENSLSNLLNVYPNPAHDVLNIDLPPATDTYAIKLVNILGAVVYEEKIKSTNDNISIHLANKVKGIYFLSVESASEKVTRKIIID